MNGRDIQQRYYRLFDPMGGRIIDPNFIPKHYLRKTLKIILPTVTHGTTLDISSDVSPYKKYIRTDNYLSVEMEIGGSIRDGAQKIPMASNSVHAVICTNVLEHLPDPEQCLSEIRRVLKPECHAVITTPFMIPFHNTDGDYNRWTHMGLERLMNLAGLKPVKIVSTCGLYATWIYLFLYQWNFRLFLSRFRVLKYIFGAIQILLFPFTVILNTILNVLGLLINDVSKTVTMSYVIVVRKGD